MTLLSPHFAIPLSPVGFDSVFQLNVLVFWPPVLMFWFIFATLKTQLFSVNNSDIPVLH